MIDVNTTLLKEYKEAEESHRKENKLPEINVKLNSMIEKTIDSKAADLMGKWYLNSRVLDGKLLTRYSEVAEHISKKLGIEFTEQDAKQAKTGLQRSINRNLSDADKIALVQEQVSLVFHQASMDRGKAVALQETLEQALQNLVDALDGNVMDALLSKSGKSLLFFIQTQQKIAQEANDRVLVVLEKMLGFGTTRDANDQLYRLLNAGEEKNKPLSGHEVLSILAELDRGGVLPSSAGQVNLDYNTFDQEDKSDESTTITGSCAHVQEEEPEETELPETEPRTILFDPNFPD